MASGKHDTNQLVKVRAMFGDAIDFRSNSQTLNVMKGEKLGFKRSMAK